MVHTLRQLNIWVGVLFAVLALSATVHAQVMQSTNYRIESDSVNFEGGRGTSANYILEDTGGEVGSGISDSSSYRLSAGYQHTLVDYISLTAAASVVMSPSLGGVTGGTANGSTTVTVTTDSAAGYQLNLKASTSPAMQSGANTIADYTPSGANPDFTFSVAVGTGEFAFSPEGTDIATRYKDNGVSCNTGSGDTTLSCWDALTTTDRTISTRATGNHPSGIGTTIQFRTGLGANSGIVNGTYIATTTLTAFAL